jgi:hypothetical protein
MNPEMVPRSHEIKALAYTPQRLFSLGQTGKLLNVRIGMEMFSTKKNQELPHVKRSETRNSGGGR